MLLRGSLIVAVDQIAVDVKILPVSAVYLWCSGQAGTATVVQ